jgi:hypothetical protein
MTDITTITPISIRRFALSRPRLPRLGIAISLNEIAWLVGDALNLVLVDPFSRHSNPPVTFSEDLEGRDPNW